MNELILTDTQKQDHVIPSSLHRHNDNDSAKMSSSDKVTHEKTKEEPSSLHRHKDNGSLKMSSNDIVTHKETKDEPYSLHRHNDNGSLKISSNDNVTHKKIKDEPYSLSTGSHRDNSSLKMSSINNVTHKRTREEPSSLNSHKDNDSLKISLQDNIHADFTNAPDVHSHVDKTRNIDESSNYYDTTNHTLYPKQTSTSGSTDHVYDRVEQYGHSYVPTPDGQHTDVQIAQSNNGSLSFPNNIQFHPPDELFPDATRRGSSFSDAIPSPYVDEAVKKGMDSERQYRIRRSSTLSFEHNYDAAIRDLMKEAEDWASKDK